MYRTFTQFRVSWVSFLINKTPEIDSHVFVKECQSVSLRLSKETEGCFVMFATVNLQQVQSLSSGVDRRPAEGFYSRSQSTCNAMLPPRESLVK